MRDETNVRAGNAQTRLRAIHALKKRRRRGRKACILGDDDILNQVVWRTIAVLSTECCEWEEIRMENNTGQLSVVGKKHRWNGQRHLRRNHLKRHSQTIFRFLHHS